MPSKPTDISVLRERVFFEHEGLYRRDKTFELLVVNKGPSDAVFALFVFNEFMVGLHVFDPDGYELSVVPNDLARQGQVKNLEDPFVAELQKLEKLNNTLPSERQVFPIVIAFPQGRELRPDEPRLVKFVFGDRFRAENSNSGLDFFFDSPTYFAFDEKPMSENFDTFVVIQIPVDTRIGHRYAIKAPTQKDIQSVGSRVHVNEAPGGLSIRFPVATTEYRYSVRYTLRAAATDRAFWLTFLVVSLLVSILINSQLLDVLGRIWAAVARLPPSPISSLVLDATTRSLVAGLFIAIIGGLITVLNVPGFRRTRVILIVPLVSFLIALLLAGSSKGTP